MKILDAADDAVFRLLLRSTLAQSGHEVTTAENGRRAWELYQSQPVSMLITDWMMPDIDGPSLCRLIRAERRKDYTYIVLVTSLSGLAHYLEAMDAGADDFLTKPFEGEYLAARVRVAERVLALQSRVERLEGLLPICSYCKRIRGAGDAWSPVEEYIHRHTGDELTHGICPTCYETVAKPELERFRAQRKP